MKSHIGSKDSLKFIWQIAKSFPVGVGTAIFTALYWALDSSIRPYIFKILLDRVSEGNKDFWYLGDPALWWLVMSFGLIIVFRLYNYCVEVKMIPNMEYKLASLCMNKLFLQSNQFYQDNFAGSLGNRVNDVINHTPKLIQIITDRFLSTSILMIASVGMLWSASSIFGIIMLGWISACIVLTIYMFKYVIVYSEDLSKESSTLTGKIIDSLSNMFAVRLFARKAYEGTIIEAAAKKVSIAESKLYWAYFIMWGFIGFSLVLVLGLDFYFLIKGYIAGSITIGDFAFVLTISIHIGDQLFNLAENLSQFSKSLGKVTQGLTVVLATPNILDKKDAKELVISQGGRIAFQNVTFCYKDTNALFEDKSLTIHGGQKVGLVGYSGGGKSTFVNLILRIFDINGGKILVDDQDIVDVTQESLCSAIGMIPQDAVLFHRTLMENIRYGRIDASDEEVIEAAKKAYAHEFIMQVPKGYDTLVGERGVKLSGGQRQRIAIARAILKNAPILMLDEATSQLDSVTESEIQDSLWHLMQDKTTIVIAHRLSTLLHMDRIIVFDKGTIVEDGTHTELLQKNGLYKILWDAQVGGFLPDKKSDTEF